MLAQARAITRGDEAITTGLIRSVAHDSFRMARPILDALKSGSIQDLYNVDDVLPVDIETLLRVMTNKAELPLTIQTKGSEGKDSSAADKQETSSGQEFVPTTSPTREPAGLHLEESEIEESQANGADSLTALVVQGRKPGVPVYDLLRQAGCLSSEQGIEGRNK
jgi:hypothetical protein